MHKVWCPDKASPWVAWDGQIGCCNWYHVMFYILGSSSCFEELDSRCLVAFGRHYMDCTFPLPTDDDSDSDGDTEGPGDEVTLVGLLHELKDFGVRKKGKTY